MICIPFEPTLQMDVSEDSCSWNRDEEVLDEELSSTQETWYKCVPDTLSCLRSLQNSKYFKFPLGNPLRSSNIAGDQRQEKDFQHTTRTVHNTGEEIDLAESSVQAHKLPTTRQYYNKQNDLKKTPTIKITKSLCSSNSITNNVPGRVTNTSPNDPYAKNNETKRSQVQDNTLKNVTIPSSGSVNPRGHALIHKNNSAVDTQRDIDPKKRDSLHQSQNVSTNLETAAKGLTGSVDSNAEKQNVCLNVHVMPCMRYKGVICSKKCDRHLLDKIVKELIQKSPAHLMDWSIIHGLIRPKQICDKCQLSNKVPVQMNLVQYTNETSYVSTGGYVWRCRQCKPAFEKTIFRGSIFDNTQHLPVTAYKLIYHWINNTDINCITSWVQVDRSYVNHFFTLIRAVCTSAVHEHLTQLGGSGKIIQVGIITLKSVEDVNRRPVSILGILDQENRLVRLQAVEPLKNGKKCTREKMARILKPLLTWIHKDSIICTDYSINIKFLMKMGFSVVHQVRKDGSSKGKYLNTEIQNYLKDDIPQMFKEALFKLPRSVIQQFLEELTWREKWNESPLEAFNHIIKHIAEQTRISEEIGLINRLQKVVSEPFKEWNYKNVNGDGEEVILLSDASTD